MLVLGACAHHEDTHPFNPPIPDTQAQSQPAGDTTFIRHAGAPANGSPDQVGLATWYGKDFAGKRTSNGERFDPHAMTAAHRKLPFGTWVEVRRPDTGRSVRVRINDRGPWGDAKRIIDLSRAAADELGIVEDGVVRVELYVVRSPNE
jgi:rare lipoprotein A